MKVDFFKENRKRLLEIMPDNSLCVLFSGKPVQKSADETFPFTPNRNFYYLTGISQENCILILSRTNKKNKEYLWVEPNNPSLARWVGEKITLDEASKFSGIIVVKLMNTFEETLHQELSALPYPEVYIDLERRSFQDVITPTQYFAHTLLQKYPYIKIQNAYPMICNLRLIKTPEEVEKIRKAIDITHLGLQRIVKHLKPGIKENDIEAHFDFELTSKGACHAFHTIAASGVNASVLHYNDNNCELGDGDLLLLDLGAQYENYNADISRTFPINGKFSARQKEVYQMVLDTQLEVIEKIKPGVPFASLNECCKGHLCHCTTKNGLIKEDSQLFEYYFHGVSHYLGLDTHDVGKSEELRPGMIITVEPGLYIREENLGVRIEDDILVTEKGCENLSKSIPKTIPEIEHWMGH